MNPDDPARGGPIEPDRDSPEAPTIRLLVLIAIGFVISNLVVAVAIDRDSGLGQDELIALAGAVVFALAVTWATSRRRGRS